MNPIALLQAILSLMTTIHLTVIAVIWHFGLPGLPAACLATMLAVILQLASKPDPGGDGDDD